MQNLKTKILSAIRQVVNEEGPIQLHAPSFSDLEKKYVLDCIDSSFVSSAGYYLDKFEKELAKFTGAKYAICCVNATAALHMALLSLDVNPDDEVLVPALSFVATANAVCHARAIPHFVDVEPETLAVDPESLATYLSKILTIQNGVAYNRITAHKVKALIVMHCFGYPAHIDTLLEIAKRYQIPVIEDAAQGLGSFYRGKHLGTFGQLSVLSFNGNKIITSGGGGAILTDDEKLAKKIKHRITTAKIPHAFLYQHDELGYNYRLPNLNAALGLAQLQRLTDFLQKKKELHQKYKTTFAEMEEVTFLTERPGVNANHWLNAIILSDQAAHLTQEIISQAHQEEIYLRPVWGLLPKQNHLQHYPCMALKHASALEKKVINLPSSSFLVK